MEEIKILEVYGCYNEKNDKVVNWRFPTHENAYFLIGVLELIKQDLIEQINDTSNEAIDGDD